MKTFIKATLFGAMLLIAEFALLFLAYRYNISPAWIIASVNVILLVWEILLYKSLTNEK